MKEVKETDINEIIRLAFAKYMLSHSKKSMNTFIFTQYKNNHLTDEELEKICNTLDKKIIKYEYHKKLEQEKQMQKEIEKKLCLIK